MMNLDINLLPKPMQASRRRRMYGLRLGKLLQRIYVLLIFVIGLHVVIWLALNSILLTVQMNGEIERAGIDVVSQVRELNATLVGLEVATDELRPWTVQVGEILDLVPSGMLVRDMEVMSGSNVLIVRGAAAEREAQLDFQQRLESLSWVQRVEAPLENFALGPDAGFSFSIYRR